ncbi:MAG: response regulator transcription factor [Sandaracinaceae bacterium]|nr:response regulator transcription factor [Sandaracinaceae bacterium]
MRVLLVDDDLEVRDLLVRALERDGHSVVGVGSMAEARHALELREIDVAVLDLALPDGLGDELTRELRAARSHLPVLVLTAHTEVAHRVASLDAGADDFLGKPFAVAELRARVRALGRRRGTSVAASIVTIGDARIELSSRRASRAGRAVSLTPREWCVIEALATRAGRVCPRASLLDEAWGEASESAAASLEVLVGRIRRKLGDAVIRTVRGEGYVLETS